jgi:fructose-bisphosphate aldolase, class I
MTLQELAATAHQLVGSGKGLLAMDESNGTCDKRFAAVGVPQTEEARRAYRELIVTTPRIGESISGAILYDETIRQRQKDDTLFVRVLNDAGIIPGIKVDTGAKPLAGHPGETITEGLDGLRARLRDYSRWAPALPNGGPSFPRPMACLAEAASRPMCMRWPGTRLCARKSASFPLSSRKC